MSGKVYKIIKGVVLGNGGEIYTDEIPHEALGADGARQKKLAAYLIANKQIALKPAPKAPKASASKKGGK